MSNIFDKLVFAADLIDSVKDLGAAVRTVHDKAYAFDRALPLGERLNLRVGAFREGKGGVSRALATHRQAFEHIKADQQAVYDKLDAVCGNLVRFGHVCGVDTALLTHYERECAAVIGMARTRNELGKEFLEIIEAAHSEPAPLH